MQSAALLHPPCQLHGANHRARHRHHAFSASHASPRRVHAPARCQGRLNVSEDATLDRRLLLSASAAFGLLVAGGAPLPAKAAECALSTAPSGIAFCDTREGTGKEPAKGSLIRCHYRGRLASNNAVFDSSYERGRPLTFKVGAGEVIQGWDKGILGTEGIPAMKEGGKRTLVIPPELAYGARGAGRGLIPPGATLIFDVELLGRK
ncbi:hypothetical protein WJX81_002092 [Elliptochloris bilobata]|uniref:peptidylprolyl isomerase n=1 Tax=Elliptochloris bilobata TaxID=381761 RepID=A0AAW1RUI7_9CHLO